MPSCRRLARTVLTATLLAIGFTTLTFEIGATPKPPEGPSEAEILRDASPEDLFALQLVVPQQETESPWTYVLIQAYNPYTHEPIVDLPVTLQVELEGDDGLLEDPVQHELRTGLDGMASLHLSLPAMRQTAVDLYLEAEATFRGLTRQVESEVYFYEQTPRTLLSLDRRLYQPGQTVHVRGLWLDSSGRPMAGEPVSLEIQDDRERQVARVQRTTSDLGIASFDWPIPPSARLTDYEILAHPDAEFPMETSFSVRPYEPSTLWLQAHPRQSILLPGDTAVVDVEARTTNGDPLADAEVRMVYAPQRYGAASSGTALTPSPTVRTDARGHATVHMDLTDAFDDLGRRQPFGDLPFRIEVQDPTTLRSESVEFDLRLSRHEVHIYSAGTLGDGLPNDTYLVAQWADGEPFNGWLEVQRSNFVGAERRVGRVRTHRFGVASTAHLRLDPYSEYEVLAFPKEDAARQENTGTSPASATPLGRAEVYWYNEKSLRLLVARPLRRVGEALEVDLHVAQPSKHLSVFVFDEAGHRLAHDVLASVESSTRLSFPYQDDFQGVLTVLALKLSPDPHMTWGIPSSSRQVVYPQAAAEDLQLRLSTPQTVHRPGASARLDLQVQHPQGDAAVALAMVDRATEARQASLGLGDQAAVLAPLDQLFDAFDPFALRLGPWSLQKLQHLPEPERYGEEAQQVARALLGDSYTESPESERDDPLDRQRPLFLPLISDHDRVSDALSRLRKEHPEFVVDAPSFSQALYELGVDVDTLRDPWDRPYRIETSIQWKRRSFQIVSIGRDGLPETVDDFAVWSVGWPFAHRLGEALQSFASANPSKAHAVLSDPELRSAAMARRGLPWEDQQDPWGHPYDLRWRLQDRHVRFELVSRGPDGKWQEDASGGSAQEDDVVVWNFSFPFAAHQEGLLRNVLQDPSWHDRLPRDETSFRRQLRQRGVDADTWTGPWGHPMFFTFDETTVFIDTWHEDEAGRRMPQPQEHVFDVVHLWSSGTDGLRDSDDDLKLARLHRPRGGERAYFMKLGHGLPASATASLLGDEGRLTGVALLPDGSPIPGVLVTATATATGNEERTALTNDQGIFELTLPPDAYHLTAQLEGFATYQLANLWILPGQQRFVTITLDLATVEEIIVTAESKTASLPEAGPEPTDTSPSRSTPRLRKDFPETLFWLADGRFDDQGRLRLDIPLADNLTRWHVAALASDAEGRLASAELDVTVTQPFFLLPDLPPHLTAGDVLQLPVDVHNRTGDEVFFELELAEVASTGETESESTKRLQAQRLTVQEGIRRVTTEQPFDQVGTRSLRWTATSAQGGEASDAVQKSTQVAWRGALYADTQSRLLRRDVEMTVAVPQSSLPGSGELEVLVYDDLGSHLVKSLEGMAKKPTGCAEQTTSSAWIHVLLLDRLIQSGQGDTPLAAKSRRHATDALASLAAFQTEGGYGYWSGGEPDLALTAYVLEFLLAASEHLPVDARHIDGAATYLEEQSVEGRWPQKEKTWLRPDAAHLLHLRTEALAARALAQHGIQRDDAASLDVALLSLSRLHGEIGSDPYALALLTDTASTLLDEAALERHGAEESALAIALDAGKRLLALTQATEGHLAWHLRANTPFFGWGRSGRLATTALALQALASLKATGRVQDGDPLAEPLRAALGGGLSYLLLNKEGDGTWFTSQASVQSLRALNAVFAAATASASNGNPTLNGQPMAEDATQATFGGPKRWTRPISEGLHQLAIPAADGDDTGWRLVQTRVTSHLPWDDPRAMPRSEDLAFDVRCSDAGTTLQRGETATCDVEIGRIGYRSSGMLIAEVGLPPGAEVDEAALQEARQNRHIEDFEVWPGRVVLYVWPGYQNSEVQLTIPWRPRLALKAATQPSVLYDYYNPDARVVLAPRDVVVEGD